MADFGLSNQMHDGDFLKTSCGSPNYAAPEVIAGKLYAGPEVDVWSCGVILYVMLVGRLPFDDEYIPALFQKISAGIFTIPHFVSQAASDLLKSALRVDPLVRISVSEIRNHPFFLVNLPPYLAPLPPLVGQECENMSLENGEAEEDSPPSYYEEAITELAGKLNLSPESIKSRLKNPPSSDPECEDPVCVAYRLCADARMLWGYGARHKHVIQALDWRASPPGVSTTSNSSVASSSKDVNIVSVDSSQVGVFNRAPPRGVESNLNLSGKKKARSRWHVGIRSRSNAIDVMLELYKALIACDCEWKVLSAFSVRARDCKSEAKLELQLFRVEAGYYLVDFKRVVPQQGSSTSVFAFLDLSVRIITELARGG
jgi:serine/threonine protein kinase